MHNHIMRNVNDRPQEIDSVSKAVLAALIILGLLIAAYLIIDYAAKVDEAKAQLSLSLPANYRDTVRAMVASTGHTCRNVCSVDPLDIAPGKAAWKVRCSTGQTADACAATRGYTFSIEPAPEPSR